MTLRSHTGTTAETRTSDIPPRNYTRETPHVSGGSSVPQRRMKILHVITSLETGGAQSMLLKLVTGMDPNAFAATVVSMTGGGSYEQQLGAMGVPVVSLGMKRGRPTLRGLRRLVRLMREGRPDLVQAWMYHANVLSLVACRLLYPRPRLVWNIRHSLDDLRKEKFLTATLIRLGASVSRGADAIIYNSRAAAGQHEALGYEPSRRVLIPNGFDCEVFRPCDTARTSIRRELGIGDDAFLIGMVARYHPMKDHVGFLRAAARFAPANRDSHFLLAGPEVSDCNGSLLTEIRSLDLGERVHLIGERRDIPHVMAALDVATLCSAWGEGFPNVVGEAMACGVPCVVTNVGDAAWLVGETGEVVSPGDPGALAEAWHRLRTRGPHGRQQLGMAARRRILHLFCADKVTRRYSSLYESSIRKDLSTQDASRIHQGLSR